MHGHDFWILGQGFGTYNATKDKLTFNIINPPYRNTVGVMPGGWAYIRFKGTQHGSHPSWRTYQEMVLFMAD